jgi:hypothetical protein
MGAVRAGDFAPFMARRLVAIAQAARGAPSHVLRFFLDNMIYDILILYFRTRAPNRQARPARGQTGQISLRP